MVFPPDKAQVTQCWQADADMMQSFSVHCIRKGRMKIGPLASEFSLDHLAQVGSTKFLHCKVILFPFTKCLVSCKKFS